MASTLPWASLYEKYYDAEKTAQDYMAPESEFVHDFLLQPSNTIDKIFSSGSIKGDTLVFFGAPVTIDLLLPAYDCFKEIFVLAFLKSNQQYVEKWLKSDTEGGFNWSVALKYGSKCEEERAKCAEKVEKLRAIIQVLKADVAESGLVAPKSLPHADCVYCSSLEYLCHDRHSFIRSMKNICTLLKVGGRLVLHVVLGCTYSYTGTFKFPVLYLEEEFVRQTVTDLGLIIEQAELIPRVADTVFSTMDFSSTFILVTSKSVDV